MNSGYTENIASHVPNKKVLKYQMFENTALGLVTRITTWVSGGREGLEALGHVLLLLV